MRDPVFKAILGREAKRLAEISILWDEQEGEIIRVRDDAAREEPLFEIEDASCQIDTFELTEAALAYILRYQATN
jgi:hypothetical protein